jgi:hypothetical protein
MSLTALTLILVRSAAAMAECPSVNAIRIFSNLYSLIFEYL